MSVDQASGQSTVASGPVELSQSDAASMFEKLLNGEEPEGQPEANQEETDPDDTGEEELEAEAEGEQPEAELIEVPLLEGEGTEKITRDELKARMLMQSDYTRKTQALADERKAAYADVSKAKAEIAQRVQSLDDSLQRAATVIQSIEAQVNWQALREVDPSAYLEQREQQAERVKAFNQAKQQLTAIQAAERQATLEENHQRLVEAIPSWLDATTANKEVAELQRALVDDFRFTPEEVGKLSDYRIVLMARDAAKYRALQAKAKDVKATVEKAPKLTKPGTPKVGNAEALKTYQTVQRAKQTGNIKDVAAAFERFV